MGCPEALLEDDGDVCFDWGTASRCVLSVSVRESDGRFSWAALIDKWTQRGTCYGEPDTSLREALIRFADATTVGAH